MSSDALIKVGLTYKGGTAASGVLDFHDANQALEGFQRSLALTTHLVVNQEIITQAPALKNARVFVRPPIQGSFSIAAFIGAGAYAVYQIGTAPKDTPLGHVIYSTYDYVVNLLTGARVNFDESLGETLEKNGKTKITANKIDSLAEKLERPIINMHRPIIGASKVDVGLLGKIENDSIPEIVQINQRTFEFVNFSKKSDLPKTIEGYVSSFNINTFKGRLFVPEQGRPIPFELNSSSRDKASVSRVGASLMYNTNDDSRGLIRFLAFWNYSRDERLKSLSVIEVQVAD